MTLERRNELAFARRMIRLMGARGCREFAGSARQIMWSRVLLIDATETQEPGLSLLMEKSIGRFRKTTSPHYFIEIAKELWGYIEAHDGALIKALPDPEWMEKTEAMIRESMAHGIDSRAQAAK